MPFPGWHLRTLQCTGCYDCCLTTGMQRGGQIRGHITAYQLLSCLLYEDSGLQLLLQIFAGKY